MLVNRVKINTGQKKIYGNQILFNFEIAQAYPKTLADSSTVSERRKSIGLVPLEVYLNEMNKQIFLDKGLTKPKLYKIKASR